MRRRDCVARRHGDALRRHTARPGLDVHDHQRARGDPLLFLRRGGGEARRLDCETARHGPERHSQGIHGPACLGLSGRAGAQGHRRHVRVGREAHAALEYDLDLRLSHPRSRCDRGARARVHPGEWLYVRRAGRRSRARHRQLRSPALILLGHSQRLLRRDRETARGPPHLGAPRARALQGQAAAVVDDAVS